MLLLCFLLAFAGVAQAAEIAAPYMPGEIWNGDQFTSTAHKGIHDYCVDFNRNGGADPGSPIVAVAAGRVRKAEFSSSYGNHVWIAMPDEIQSDLYAHMSLLFVAPGESVSVGEVIGLCGETGRADGVHLHYGHYSGAQSVQISRIDGQPFTGTESITSYNDGVFDRAEGEYASYTKNLGDRGGDPHWWYRWRANQTDNCYVQGYLGGPWQGAVVYDALHGAVKAYPVVRDFWDEWRTNGDGDDGDGDDGPRSALGMPITGAYVVARDGPILTSFGTRQDFQRGYMEYFLEPGASLRVRAYPQGYAPGGFSDGWRDHVSYLFAQAYERNGAGQEVGQPLGPVETRSFCRDGVSSDYRIQGFDRGSRGRGAIFYHPDNAKYNPLATNEAYLVCGEFWEKWISPNDGRACDPAGSCDKNCEADYYGVPTNDVYMSRDPEHWDQVEEYPLQNFFRSTGDPNDRQHYMILKNGRVEWHSDPPRTDDCVPDAGSLVSDGGFDEGTCWARDNFRNQATFTFGGQLYVGLPPDPSRQYYEVAVRQLVPLHQGEKYLLSFRAWGSEAGTLIAAVQAQTFPYYSHIGTGTFLLDRTPRQFWHLATADTTDSRERLVFFLGQVSGDLWIDDVVFRRADCVPATGQVIGSPNWEGFDCWSFQNYARPRNTLVLEDEGDARVAHIQVVTGQVPGDSDDAHDAQIYQEEIHLRADKRYRLSCDIRAVPRARVVIQLTTAQTGPTWPGTFVDQSFGVNYTHWSQEVLVDNDTETGRLSFGCGRSAGDYWIKNIRLEEFDVCSREPGNAIASGSFEKLGCWSLQGSGESSVETMPTVGEGLRWHVPTAGISAWAVGARQEGIPLIAGRSYHLSAMVRSETGTFPVRVRLGTGTATDERWFKEINARAGSEWARVGFDATVPEHSFDGVVEFGLGSGFGDCQIKDVRLDLKDRAKGTRDKYTQPFSSNSIWNTPIGSEADLRTHAGLPARSAAGIDTDYWVVTKDSDPLQYLYDDQPGWPSYRCSDQWEVTAVQTRVPYDLVVEDVIVGDPELGTYDKHENNSAAILQPDGETIVQFNALARCVPGGRIWGVPLWDRRGGQVVLAPNESIYDDGISGGHGGSFLSSIGGAIRRGELLGTERIAHALKVNVWCKEDCSGLAGGYCWPAIKSDNCWNESCIDTAYHGGVETVRMGALLAIPSGALDPASLETAVGKKLYQALHDYGAYIVDNTGWDAYAFAAEQGVREEVAAYYGHSIDTQEQLAYLRDVNHLFQAFHVVANNGPESIGGPGDRIVELAPELVRDGGDAKPPGRQPILQVVTGPEGVVFTIETSMRSEVRVEVFDVAGRLVATPFRETLDPGRSEVEWNTTASNGKRIASGVYFVRLKTQTGTAIGRFVIVR